MLLQMALFHYFLWLSNIPLYVCHIFFIHFSAIGYFGCFHVLAMLSSAVSVYCAVYWGACILLYYGFSLDISPGVELLDLLDLDW